MIHNFHAYIFWSIILVQRKSENYSGFICSTPTLTSLVGTSEKSVVYLHNAAEHIQTVPGSHGMSDFVAHRLRCVVCDAQFLSEFHRGAATFILAYQIKGKKPFGQRGTAPVHDHSRRHRSLVAVVTALIFFPRFDTKWLVPYPTL